MSTWSLRIVSPSAGSTLKRRLSSRGSHLTRLKAIWAWASRVGGRPPHNRDDLFISLCDPGWAESAGFKRGVNLPGVEGVDGFDEPRASPCAGDVGTPWRLPI